jgi:hypothetical protein
MTGIVSRAYKNWPFVASIYGKKGLKSSKRGHKGWGE